MHCAVLARLEVISLRRPNCLLLDNVIKCGKTIEETHKSDEPESKSIINCCPPTFTGDRYSASFAFRRVLDFSSIRRLAGESAV